MFVNPEQLRTGSPSLQLKARVTASELKEATEFSRFDAVMHMAYDLHASQVLKKDHWRVTESFKFYYGVGGGLQWAVVPAGFLTDGASIPRMFWGVLAPWGAYGQAAALHDYLLEYQTVYQAGKAVHITRHQADRIFNESMRAAHVAKWKRRMMYVAVRFWSIFGWNKGHRYLDTKRALEAEWIQGREQ